MTRPALSFTRLSGLGPLPRLFEAHEGWPALQRLLRSQNIRLEGQAPSTPVPFANLVELFNRATELTADVLFPVRVAQAMRPEDFGPLVDYALGGATLAAGIERINRFSILQTRAAGFAFRENGREAFWSTAYHGARGVRVHHHALHVLVPMIDFVRRYAGERARPIRIELASDPDANHRRIENALGVPVRTVDEGFRVIFPSDWLQIARRGAQADEVMTFADMIDYYRRAPLPRTTTETVSALLTPIVGISQLDLDAIAGKLNMSRRTLQQQLNSEGSSFRDISLGVRINRAKRLIVAGREPIAQVAVAVGYSDQAHFTRAFKALTGATPDQFRRRSWNRASIPADPPTDGAAA